MKNLIVEEKYDGKKLNTYLLDKFPNLSQNTLFKALRKKDIRINDKRVCQNVVIHYNDDIKVFISDDLLFSNNKPLEVIYEDENILIVNKPVGIEVISELTADKNSLSDIVLKYVISNSGNFAKPCHRIDRNTTGLVLFAKNEVSLNILLDKFKNREIEKHYLATVYGILPNKENRLEAYLFKDNKKSMVYISDIPKKGYLKIITSYKILSENKEKNYSVLDVKLETGRTHQIRAHLAYIGYPIIGDGKYGINEINKKFNKKTQMLCSYKLKFCFTTNSGILNYLNGKEFKK